MKLIRWHLLCLDSCRAPRGARGLKPVNRKNANIFLGRAPRGARGLKLVRGIGAEKIELVAPRAGRVD